MQICPSSVLQGLFLCSWTWGTSSEPHQCCRATRQPELQCLPSCWGFSAFGQGVSPHSCSQQQPLLMEISDKTWSTGEGNGKPLQYSCLENPTNSMKRQKERTLKDELPRLVGAQYATGDQWRNNSRKNEKTEPKQKQHPVADVTGHGSKV